mmetsp:Transcript_951/g.1298  ORF Transcript_951/g.1298 Transcript_951/m.1298 type:complete len:119 (-) Transcript_951:272-628(-)
MDDEPRQRIPRKKRGLIARFFQPMRYAGKSFMRWLYGYGINWPVIGTMFIACGYMTWESMNEGQQQRRAIQSMQQTREHKRLQRIEERKQRWEEEHPYEDEYPRRGPQGPYGGSYRGQ